MDMEIETHVSVDKSQLGESPEVMKVGLGSCSTWRTTALQPPRSRDNLRSCDIRC